jgi:hypothetical protein
MSAKKYNDTVGNRVCIIDNRKFKNTQAENNSAIHVLTFFKDTKAATKLESATLALDERAKFTKERWIHETK